MARKPAAKRTRKPAAKRTRKPAETPDSPAEVEALNRMRPDRAPRSAKRMSVTLRFAEISATLDILDPYADADDATIERINRVLDTACEGGCWVVSLDNESADLRPGAARLTVECDEEALDEYAVEDVSVSEAGKQHVTTTIGSAMRDVLEDVQRKLTAVRQLQGVDADTLSALL